MIRNILVKTVLNKHRRRDPLFLDDYSVNPYINCSFACNYCYVRGSKYGTDIKDLAIKVNALKVLEKELKRRAEKKEYGFIALSTSTEPYQEIEAKIGLTRKILKLILKYRFPVHILTKSELVLRDVDLIKEISKEAILPKELKGLKGAIVNISISTLDEKEAKRLEPNAPTPINRLKVVERLNEEGIYAGVSNIPYLPFISDSEEKIEEAIKAAKEHKARFFLVGALTLFGSKPTDCKVSYLNYIKKYHQNLIKNYISLYKGTEPSKQYQKTIEETAIKLCKKHKIKWRIR